MALEKYWLRRVEPREPALAKVGVESSNLFARSIFRRFYSNLGPALEPGFRRLGRWGSGWGGERPDFAQAIVHVELSRSTLKNGSSQLVS